MKLIVTRIGSIWMGIACAALLVSTLAAPQVRAEEVVKSYTVAGRANVQVNTNDGGVRITTSDTKQVEFRVEYHGFELGKNLTVESRQNGDTVELTARITGHWNWNWGKNTRGLHIEVRMPREADLKVETGDGAVQAGHGRKRAGAAQGREISLGQQDVSHGHRAVGARYGADRAVHDEARADAFVRA